MKKRKSRLPVIVEILTEHSIGSQEELSKQLAARGYIVTQATLSRDLKMLRTTKVPTDLGGYRYIVADEIHTTGDSAHPAANTLQSERHPAAQSLAISGNIVVIKTRNGYASGLAYDIDMLHSAHILGTIPGADTVFAVVNEKSTRRQLLELFASFLPREVIDEARAQFED
ncbi:MAG: arginine repressor [Pseudoflavonifractor sp.]|nr:arginine repressor [Pseudoflavonifractor sp.]